MKNLDFASYFTISSETSQVFESGDGLYLLINVKKTDESTKELFDDFVKIYNSRDSGSVLQQLTKAFLNIKSRVDGECAAAVVTDGKIYVLAYGGAGVFLLRDNKLIPLIKTTKGEYTSTSGYLKIGDSFLVSDHVVFEEVPMEDVKSVLNLPSAKKSVEALTTKLLESPEVALIVFKYGENINEKIKMEEISPTETIEEKPSLQVGNPRSSAVKFIDSILDKLPQSRIKISSQEDYLNKKSKKTASLVGILLLILLAVSIYFGTISDEKKKQISAYEPRLEEAVYNIKEARELADLSPTRAQELILSAKQIAQELKNEEIVDTRLDELIEDIRKNLGEIAGIWEQDSKLFLDLSLITSGFEGNNLAFSSELIRVSDNNLKRLVGVEIENKRTETIAGPDYLPDALANFSYEDRSFIVSSDGIREVTQDVELLIKPQWSANNILAKAFASNVYILDKQENQILRYQGIRGGFLEPENWLAEGVEVDFSESVDMAIDGTIWVLSSTGKITRLSLGVPRAFNLSGDRVSFENAKKIYTIDEYEYLYILDTNNSRILMLTKEGQYVGEYSAEKLSSAVDFIVYEEGKLIVFLSEGKLYSLELKHL